MRLRFVAISLFAAATGTAAHLTLAENGRSSYSIAMMRDASPSEKRAAEELQRFLRVMSGVTLPIVEHSKQSKKNRILLGGAGIECSHPRDRR